LSNPTDTPSGSLPEPVKTGSEVELFDDLKTLNIGDDPTQVPESANEEEEYDLLTTLEMPVFRLPGAILPRSNSAPKATVEMESAPDGDEQQVPLSGILRKRRRLPTVKSEAGPQMGGVELLPHVVVQQPPMVELKWQTDLPETPDGRPNEAPAKKNGVAAPPAETSADAAPEIAKAPAPAVPKPVKRPAKAPPTPSSKEQPARPSGKATPPTPPKAAAKPKAAPPAPPAAARVEAKVDKPARARHQPPKIARQDDGEDLTGLVQELIEDDAPKRTREHPAEPAWYQQIFTEEYFRTLPMGFHKQTLREAQFVVDSLGVGDGGRILDLCCGFGRHTLDLAKRGYDMVGLDLSLPLLQKALGEAQRRKLSIKFIHGDIRELNFQEVFDATFCWHTSFGYFDDKTNFEVLRGVHRALKPGGRFLLEIVNRDFIVGLMPRRKWWEGADCLFLEEIAFNYNTSVLHTKRSFIYDDGRPPWEQNIYIRLYSLHELQNLLRLGGFNVLDVSGQTQTRGFYLGQASPNIILLAEKR
jgi:SAM-dependent methyltransferase